MMMTVVAGAVGISTLSAQTASAGLIAAYDFAQTSGQTVPNSAGSGFVATLGPGSQAPTIVSGASAGLPVNGGVAVFNGQQNQFVAVSGGGGLDGTQSGTIGMWINWTSANQMAGYGNLLYGGIMSRQENGQFTNDLIGLDGADPGTAHIVFFGATADGTQIASTSSPGVNQWHYLAVVYTPTSQQLYLDGTLDASINAGAGTIASSPLTNLTFGGWSGDGSSYGTAQLANISVWDNAMTADEVQGLSNFSVTNDNTVVPEPASASIMGIAIVGLLARRRTRRAE
jgi:hypothetical protein